MNKMKNELVTRFSVWENGIVLFDSVDHQEIMKTFNSNKNLGLLRDKGDELIVNGDRYIIESVNFALYNDRQPDNYNFQIVVNVTADSNKD